MKHTFEKVVVRKRKTGTCVRCEKRRARTRAFFQTINPWNKNADGKAKSEYEILDELHAAASAWQKLPMVCASCEENDDG